jgi:DNA polymerase-1
VTTWLLVDGNSLTYRAFFALPTDIATASGQVTNAVYGFASMLVNLVRDHRPDRVVVAFDLPEPTFRHERVETYKGQRDETPDILVQQMGLVRELVEAFGAGLVEVPGFEADDVLATLATQARDRGDDAFVVTGDRDAYQLVEDPHVRVLYTSSRGVSELKEYDEAAVAERTGVTPDRYVVYAALRGDPSDNLPGVPGVGEKKAAKLVNDYGDLDGIFAHAAEQTPKLAENLMANEELVRTNAEMMALVRDVPGVALDDFGPPAVDAAALTQLFNFLEFRSASLRSRLTEAIEVLGAEPPLDDDVDTGDAEPLAATSVSAPATTTAAATAIGGLASGGGPVGFAAAWEGEPGRSPLVGLALVGADETAVWLDARAAAEPEVLAALGDLGGAGGVPLVAHGAKPLLRWLASRGVEVRSLAHDTEVAAYLVDPIEGTYDIGDLAERHLGRRVEAATPAAGQLDLGGADDGSGPAVATAAQAVTAAHLVVPLTAALDARGLTDLYETVEVPLVGVLARMEALGVGVDAGVLRELNDEMSSEVASLTAQIHRDAGEEFNVNSTPQLRTILFDKLGLTPQRKTKTGYSTDAASLERLLGEHPIIEHLLRYREVEKLRSTYGEGLLAEVADDGRIHATFTQTVARTGRLSSEHPNLHNIPVRTDMGRRFRTAFVAADGYELLVADYNQIELRVIAHLAEDPGLISAFESGTDIHNATAASVFGVAASKVTSEQRSQAKMVSYGLAYGMEAYGLAQRLGIETGDAQAILDAYFQAFPAVRDYMDRTVAEARQRGYTETLFGRRRQIPELASPNARIRQAGERQAMNAGIQGLAADIFKVALVRIDAALSDGDLASRLILQVHDEVLLEVPPAEVDDATQLVLDAMGGAFDLRVPLEVNLATGHSWADAKA